MPKQSFAHLKAYFQDCKPTGRLGIARWVFHDLSRYYRVEYRGDLVYDELDPAVRPTSRVPLVNVSRPVLDARLMDATLDGLIAVPNVSSERSK